MECTSVYTRLVYGGGSFAVNAMFECQPTIDVSTAQRLEVYAASVRLCAQSLS